MRYVYAAIIAAAIIAGWLLAARDILHARHDARARAAVRHRLDSLPAGMPQPEHHRPRQPDPTTLYRADPERLAALRQLRDEQRAADLAPEPELVRPYVADLPADVADERPAPGWLTLREAAAVGQHPFDPVAEPWNAGEDRCAVAGCGAVSADPIHFTPRGILQPQSDDSDG